MTIDNAMVRRVGHWARGLVLAETGQPVELIHIEEIEGRRRLFIELPSGLRTHVPEVALTSRLARLAEGGLMLAGVAVAGMLLGYTLALPADALTAWHGRPAIEAPAVDG